MSLDIGNIELVLRHRQKRMLKKLLEVSAEEIAPHLSALAIENCNGCLIDHPSQREHPCIMMEKDEQLYTYFDRAVERASENKIMEAFTKQVGNTPVRVQELIKYTAEDWKSDFCTDHRWELKQEVLERI